MLARKNRYELPNGVTLETPLLIPSFSSKGFPDLRNVIQFMRGFITDAALISAYDVYYSHLNASNTSFPEVLFLDSGGYEASVEHDLSEAYGHAYKPKPWTQRMHEQVVRNWPKSIATVAVTFDSPSRSFRLKEQIRRASQFRAKFADVATEILIKPEDARANTVPIEQITSRAKEFRQFAAVGVTEKELGRTVLDRLKNIARIRTALDTAHVEVPLHIFGSLDASITPIYFLAGAEIFDGLTWLRFGYHDGSTVYNQNYSMLRERDWLRLTFQDLSIMMWKNNYYYLQRMRDQMFTYLRTGDFAAFGNLSGFLNEAGLALEAHLRTS